MNKDKIFSFSILGGDKIKIAEEFCYLGDMLGKDEKARRTVSLIVWIQNFSKQIE